MWHKHTSLKKVPSLLCWRKIILKPENNINLDLTSVNIRQVQKTKTFSLCFLRSTIKYYFKLNIFVVDLTEILQEDIKILNRLYWSSSYKLHSSELDVFFMITLFRAVAVDCNWSASFVSKHVRQSRQRRNKEKLKKTIESRKEIFFSAVFLWKEEIELILSTVRFILHECTLKSCNPTRKIDDFFYL